MLKIVNKLQNIEAHLLHFLASKYSLTQISMHYKSNKVAYIKQDDNSMPVGALSRIFPK